MALTKNPITRYMTLDRCFRNPGRDYTVDMLVEACNADLLEIDPKSTGVKKRQVYDDIKFMRDPLGYNAPIETRQDGRYAIYFYEDRNFSINNQPLNEQEAQKLKETIMTLSRFKGLPQFDWMDEMLSRLEQSFSLKTEEKIISFDENEYLTGREYIGELYQAIINKQCLDIVYQPYNVDEPMHFIIHPYHLKEYNGRWFLFGLNDENGLLWNLPLDRIQTIEKFKKNYIENTSVDFSEYFDDVVGVTVNDKPVEKVILEVVPSLMPYIKSKPLHGSQKPRGESRIELSLQINYEFKAAILSYGDRVQVLEPQWLKGEIREILKNAFEKYD